MRIYFLLLLFFLFVIPTVMSIYKRDAGQFLFVKVINVIIAFILYINYAGNFGEFIAKASQNNKVIDIISIKIDLLSSQMNFIFEFIYMLLGFIISILSILIVLRKEAGRKIFVSILPVLCILEGIRSYYVDIKYLNTSPTPLQNFTITLVMCIPYVVLFFIYRSKRFKQFFRVITPDRPDL